MSPAAGAKKRPGGGGGGGFALGCGCRDAKAVAVAVAASAASASPYSATATDTSTATTATTWRGARTTTRVQSSASGSTGTLTVPSASSSSFPWEDGEPDADGEEVNCKRESSATTTSFSGLLRQLNELEQSVASWGRKGTGEDYLSPPPPPPPPPPLPERPAKQRAAHSGDGKEGHGNFSPSSPHPPSNPFQKQQQQQQRKEKSMDKGDRQAAAEAHSMQPPLPLPPEQLRNAKSTEKGFALPPEELRSAKSTEKGVALPPEQLRNAKSTEKGGGGRKEGVSSPSPQHPPKHRKSRSCDGDEGGARRLDGTVAVVKQSDDPLGDFRRSMVNMIVENRIATGDELRELLRHFLALNAPRHHDAILRAFTEIWDEAFAGNAKAAPHREQPAARPTPPRARQSAPTPPRRRHAPRAWR